MKTTYAAQGACTRFIDIEVENGIVVEVRFIGGCTGNTGGISSLVQGMPVMDVIQRLKGILCREGTSCPDQLARALETLQLQKAS